MRRHAHAHRSSWFHVSEGCRWRNWIVWSSRCIMRPDQTKALGPDHEGCPECFWNLTDEARGVVQRYADMQVYNFAQIVEWHKGIFRWFFSYFFQPPGMTPPMDHRYPSVHRRRLSSSDLVGVSESWRVFWGYYWLLPEVCHSRSGWSISLHASEAFQDLPEERHNWGAALNHVAICPAPLTNPCERDFWSHPGLQWGVFSDRLVHQQTWFVATACPSLGQSPPLHQFLLNSI